MTADTSNTLAQGRWLQLGTPLPEDMEVELQPDWDVHD